MQPLDQPLTSPVGNALYTQLVRWWERRRLYFNIGLSTVIIAGFWDNDYLHFFTWRDLPLPLIIVFITNWLYCTGTGLQSLLVYYGPRWLGSSVVGYLIFVILLVLLGFYVYTFAQGIAPLVPSSSFF